MEKKYYVKVNELGAFWYADEAMTVLHREDGPALEYANGDKVWYQNGQRHRLDGPAVERVNAYKSWWQNGKRHRLDGPAIERTNGHKEWWQNDECHRLDGPAVEYGDGTKEYWINGSKLTKQEFLARTQAPTCEGRIVTIDGVDYKLTKI